MEWGRRIGRGLAFVFLSAIGVRALSLGADLFLVRLLSVADFGVMAFGLMIVNALGLVRSMGVGEALIFSPDADAQTRDTGLYLALGAGLVLGGGLYAAAPGIAGLLRQGDVGLLVEVLQVLAVVLFVEALAGVPSALLERELAFHRKLYVDVLPALVYALSAVGLAAYGAGVWSLVIGRVAGAVCGCLAAWLLSPWRPSWRFSAAAARQLGGYGRYIAAGGLLSFAVVNLDDALLGYLVGGHALGLYFKAYLWANLPATALAQIVGRVAFPAYARLQGEPRRRLYIGLVQTVGLLALPWAVSLALMPQAFALGVLGGQWGEIADFLPWLAAYGVLRALLSNSGPAFNALGIPQAIVKVNLLQAALLALLLYPLIERFGVLGCCWGVLAATLCSGPLAMAYLRREADMGWAAWGQALTPLAWPAAALLAAGLGARQAVAGWADLPAWAAWLVVGAAGTLAYGAVLARWRRQVLSGALGLLKGEGI